MQVTSEPVEPPFLRMGDVLDFSSGTPSWAGPIGVTLRSTWIAIAELAHLANSVCPHPSLASCQVGSVEFSGHPNWQVGTRGARNFARGHASTATAQSLLSSVHDIAGVSAARSQVCAWRHVGRGSHRRRDHRTRFSECSGCGISELGACTAEVCDRECSQLARRGEDLVGRP
jgi:hypothetical protein